MSTNITKDSALLLLKMRNLIHEETGIRVSLSAEDTVDRLLELGSKSDNARLQQMMQELKTLVGDQSDHHSHPVSEHARVYRGVLQAEATPVSEEKKTHHHSITYRGQKTTV